MVALAKLCSYPDSILRAFFLRGLPKVVRIVILGVCLLWKHYRLVATNHKYMSSIDKRSSRFSYGKRASHEPELPECSICLSGFEDGEEGREVLECNHAFHRHCLERWLLQAYCSKAATCPLCRSLVVPEVVVAEYQRVLRTDREDGHWVEKELALTLLNTFHCGSRCNEHFSFTRGLFG